MVELAAHALLLGERDWRDVLVEQDDTEEALQTVVWQRALDLRHEEQKRLATMIGNAMSGAKTIDGRRTGPNTTSTG